MNHRTLVPNEAKLNFPVGANLCKRSCTRACKSTTGSYAFTSRQRARVHRDISIKAISVRSFRNGRQIAVRLFHRTANAIRQAASSVTLYGQPASSGRANLFPSDRPPLKCRYDFFQILSRLTFGSQNRLDKPYTICALVGVERCGLIGLNALHCQWVWALGWGVDCERTETDNNHSN